MKTPDGLPPEVVSALRSGRKIEAIKLLREAKGIGLKEAKHAVDAYIRANPSIQPPKSGGNGMLFIVFVVFLGYVAYQFLK